MSTVNPALAGSRTSTEAGEEPTGLREPQLRSARRRNPLFWLLLIVLSLIIILPLAWTMLTAIKSNVESRAIPPTVLPSEPTLQAFGTLFFTDDSSPVLLWALNSLIAASAHAIIVVIIASMAGYALARMEFPLKKLIFGMIIATLFIPGFIFMMPNFLILNELNLLDTLWAVILPGAAGAFGVFFMRQFFSSFPISLEESARIDGAGPWRIFFSIVLPNARAALVTLTVLSFLANWNDFLWPIYALFSPDRLVLPVGLTQLQGAYSIDYPVIMAGAAIAAIPVLILYTFVQRYVIEGVASSGIKG